MNYRIPWAQMTTGVWQRVSTAVGMHRVEVEPGFLTDAYGSLNAYADPVTVLFGCGTGGPETWDLCYTH